MTTRRKFLVTVGGIATVAGLAVASPRAHGTPAALQDAIRKLIGGSAIRRGRVKLDLPPLIDNGNTVPLTVTVESPMRPDDYVKAIHVLAEQNPLPNVLSAYLGPRAGRARVVTRIRLADTQKVIAIAELSDGSFWSDTADVVVTLSACLENLV